MAAYSYTPTYYSSFHDSITSLCKSILQPLSLRTRRRLPDQKLHSDTLKWQQDSFHRILHLIGLHNEGMASHAELSAFRSHLLDTLISSPAHPEPSNVIRDKLLFLQELFHAKCISSDEYHSSKRPLLQRLAVQGVEVDCRDVFIGTLAPLHLAEAASGTDVVKEQSPMVIKSITGKPGRGEESHPSILLAESSPVKTEKTKRRPFRALFYKEQRDEESCNNGRSGGIEERVSKSAKKPWGFKKWKKDNYSEEEPLNLSVASDDGSSSVPCTLMAASETKIVKDCVGEMKAADEIEKDGGGSGSWVAFEENDENFHPNLFVQDTASSIRAADVLNGKVRGSRNDCFLNNPFHEPQNLFWDLQE